VLEALKIRKVDKIFARFEQTHQRESSPIRKFAQLALKQAGLAESSRSIRNVDMEQHSHVDVIIDHDIVSSNTSVQRGT